LGTSVPDVDLGLQAVDGLGICLGELLVGAILDHQVAHEAVWATEDISKLAIGIRHLIDTLGLLLLCVKGGFGLLSLSVICFGQLVSIKEKLGCSLAHRQPQPLSGLCRQHHQLLSLVSNTPRPHPAGLSLLQFWTLLHP
jgi:hypothetical protein